MFYDANIRFQLSGQIVLLPDTGDTLQILSGTFSMFAAQLITPRARVRVQIEKRFSFSFSDSMIRL